jgi:hypothetical protein
MLKFRSRSLNFLVVIVVVTVAISYLFYPPANTLEEPAATEVHPAIASPILPAPLELTKTVVDPTAIGAAWAGQGTPGSKCVVFKSP